MLGVALAAAGILLIATLPVAPWLRAAAAAGWLLYARRDLAGLLRGYGRYRRVAIDQDRRLRLLDTDGSWLDARALPGSVVLRRCAWLRIRDHTGLVYAEPLTGSCRGNPEWRRLQVIWRHVGAAT